MGWYISGKPAPRIGDIIRQGVGKPKTYPLGEKNCSLFFSGRYALAAGITALGFSRGDRILVPSYNCGVELDPIAYHRLEPIFYNIKKDFCVDLDDLSEKCKCGPKGLVVTHFLGFPQPMEEIGELCRQRGVLLIEDCAHAFLSCHGGRPLGAYGEASIFSLLKSLPVASGGLLVLNSDRKACGESAVPPRGFPAWIYLSELTAKRSYDASDGRIGVPVKWGMGGVHLILTGVKKGIAGFRRLFNRGGDLLVRPDGFTFEKALMNRGVSRLCSRIISNTDFQVVKTVRRRNYAHLLEHFKRSEDTMLPITDLPEGVCPLFFPILVNSKEERGELYLRMRERGIITHPWWDRFRRDVPWEDFPDAVYLKERVMGLPIHQDLGEGAMNRIIDAFEEVRCDTPAKRGRPPENHSTTAFG